MVAFSTDQLIDLLPVYYKRLFPYGPFYRWLSYGLVNPNTFCNREMSFTLPGDIYIRYQSFDKKEDFEQELIKKCPEKIDIGGIYNIKPKLKRMTSHFDVEEKELVFDIDMTDYDNVRTCCKEAEVCSKCWKFLSLATKILDTALREDFGFEHLLWVFSGRRGVHCWVCDSSARRLEPRVRADIAEYLQVLSKEDAGGKMAHIPSDRYHPSIRRAVEIIRSDFEEVCVVGQDMLGGTEGMRKVLAMLGDPALKDEVSKAWERNETATSLQRWQLLLAAFQRLSAKGGLSWRYKYLVEEIMLHYAYPRLDIEVSKGSNHLLKAPFCIHPKTGKVCVPFNPRSVDKFDPSNVPTITELVEEIQNFDAKEAENSTADFVKRKVKDYKKTRMYKGMQVFEEFLRNLEETWKSKKPKVEGMEF